MPTMTDEEAKRRAEEDRREGKAPSTQAGEFVREEIEHVREGEHGARSAKQAIAIGLSKARRAGVAIPRNPSGKSQERTESKTGRKSRKRAASSLKALRRESKSSTTRTALAKQTKASAKRRGKASRRAAARKAARTRSRSRR